MPALEPSTKFISAGVALNCVELSAAKTGIVPETLGSLIVLSAVGSIVVKVVSWSSAGAKGFKGSRKSTPYAAQIAADDAGARAYEQGLRTLTVQVKGPGSGRETALRSLQSKGFKILSIKDTTPMPHNGARPPKRRRV
mgnify:CR=1 FL=1